jgi:hypothetical protein
MNIKKSLLISLIFMLQNNFDLQASTTQAEAAAMVFPDTLPTVSIHEKTIDKIYGTTGLNIPTVDLANIKKTYCYLEYLVKIEKIKKDKNLAQSAPDFKPFLEVN